MMESLLSLLLILAGAAEAAHSDLILRGAFYGINIAIALYLFATRIRSGKPIQLAAGFYVLVTVGLLFTFQSGFDKHPAGLFPASDIDANRIIFFTALFSFTLLMVVRYVTDALKNHGVTDTFLAMAFGMVVFAAVVGPFLEGWMALNASLILLLFLGLFTAGFSFSVQERIIPNGMWMIITMLIANIAWIAMLLRFTGSNLPLDVLHILVPSTVTFCNAALMLLVAPVVSPAETTEESESTGIDSGSSVTRLLANDRRKDEYVGMVAHELRTPLGGIVGISEMLSDGAEGELPPAVITNLNLIAQSGRRLSYLLNDLLDLSKIKHNVLNMELVPVHLRSAVSKVLALQYVNAAAKGIELRNNVPSDLPAVLADPDKLEQILHNLITNSVKFTEEGYVAVEANHKEGEVTIIVEDTGKGLSKDNIQKLLDSFSEEQVIPASTSRKGTGIGLKISNRLIELHNSKLQMESAEGFGSYFSFTLKTTDEPADKNDPFENYSIGRRAGQAPLTQLRPHRNVRISEQYQILIIDDEPINVKVLTAQLGREGYLPLSCNSGPKALEHIRENGIPDLVLLDIMMPNMNGYEVLREIRKEFSKIELPVLMLTAKNHTTDIIEAFRTGANDYIAKPIAKDELLARIRTHLELSKISHAFSRFVPHEFLGFLGYQSMLDIKLGDQVETTMTVLFCDIKGFTRLSETLKPKEAFDFINTFLGVVSPVIRECGGFIDKFIGDAIMALFPGSADDAVRAALRMTLELKELNKSRIKSGLSPIRIGTGVHTGDLMLGTIGEEMRMEGTVISDVVNTTSRLEGLTKLFDNSVIISSHTKNLLKEHENLNYRYLGKTRVKGKESILDVYGIIEGDEDETMKLELESAQAFELGVKEFYDRNFTRASVHFNEVLKIHPGDKAANIFLKRSAHLMITGVPENWSGVDESMNLLERGD